MSDKLEKCVCGGEPKELTGDHIHHENGYSMGTYKRLKCYNCGLQTSPFTDGVELPPAEVLAAEEWRTIQRALKSGWSSEVPTEAGFYLVCTKWFAITCVEVDETLHFINDDELCDVSDWDADKTFWYRINYPDPPKD